MANKKTSTDPKKDILTRLNRIEGQVKGIQRMITEEKTCVDILTQVAAIRAAINKVGSLILENHTKECLVKSIESGNKEEAVKSLTETIEKFLKFVD